MTAIQVKPQSQSLGDVKERISVSSYTEAFYNWFSSIGISRVVISRSCSGKLQKEHVTSWRLFLFIILRINLALKIGYLFYLLLVPQEGEPLDFLTLLGIGIYIVLAFIAVYSDYYFAQIYPSFELFCAFWDVQTNIYSKLSVENKQMFKTELKKAAKTRTRFHTCASLNAMFGLAIQYVVDPKGIIFTGSLTKANSFLALVFLGAHEEIFMISVWYQAVAIVLIPNLVSSELRICLKYLSKELERLQVNKLVHPVHHIDTSQTRHFGVSRANGRNQDDGEYTIEEILFDYQNLEVVADRLKAISSFILLISEIIYLTQITSDVFVGIRLYRMGDTTSVAFYAADCTTGMGYCFFSLQWIGKLDDAMQKFASHLKSYFKLEYKKEGFISKWLWRFGKYRFSSALIQ